MWKRCLRLRCWLFVEQIFMSVLQSCILLEQNTQPGFIRFGLDRNPGLRSGEFPVCIYDFSRREDVGTFGRVP